MYPAKTDPPVGPRNRLTGDGDVRGRIGAHADPIITSRRSLEESRPTYGEWLTAESGRNGIHRDVDARFDSRGDKRTLGVEAIALSVFCEQDTLSFGSAKRRRRNLMASVRKILGARHICNLRAGECGPHPLED